MARQGNKMETSTTLDVYIGAYQDTSAQAYEVIRKHVTPIHKKIIELLEKNPDGLSIAEIALELGYQKSSICPRVSELRHDKIILYHEKRQTFTGFTSLIWGLSPSYKELVEE